MTIVLTTDAKHRLLLAAAAHLGGNAKLGRALGYRDGAFIGQMLRGIRPITEKTILQMQELHALKPVFLQLSADDPVNTGEAHVPSLNEFDYLPFIARELVMSSNHELSGLFKTEMPDESLADKIPKGTILVFEACSDVAPGRVILIQTANGKRLIRRYAEGRNGEWSGLATNPMYSNVKSTDDDLTVIAVLRWIAAD